MRAEDCRLGILHLRVGCLEHARPRRRHLRGHRVDPRDPLRRPRFFAAVPRAAAAALAERGARDEGPGQHHGGRRAPPGQRRRSRRLHLRGLRDHRHDAHAGHLLSRVPRVPEPEAHRNRRHVVLVLAEVGRRCVVRWRVRLHDHRERGPDGARLLRRPRVRPGRLRAQVRVAPHDGGPVEWRSLRLVRRRQQADEGGTRTGLRPFRPLRRCRLAHLPEHDDGGLDGPHVLREGFLQLLVRCLVLLHDHRRRLPLLAQRRTGSGR
mmetsp:Transcript_142622/g.355480  ORF Transcript_142622/g.355480 Transcript_142622/m.355480 type:complete len:265 (-) Transcript_142622:446-1240(-)